MNFESTIHRAAILVKSLPQKQANKLLSQLDSNELQVIFKKIRNLGEIPPALESMAIKRFVETAGRLRNNSENLGQPGERMQPESGPLDFFIDTSNDLSYRILENEHPTNVAAVLSFLPTHIASSLLKRFEAPIRVTILRRLCQNEALDFQAIAKLSEQLKVRLNGLLKSEKYKQSGIGVATNLLSCSDSRTRHSLFESLTIQDPDLAIELRHNVLDFSSIANFRDAEIKVILNWVDTSLWAPALKNTYPNLRQKILGNMADKPRAILNREIDVLDRVEDSLSEASQAMIVNVCLQLVERKRIKLPNSTTSNKYKAA